MPHLISSKQWPRHFAKKVVAHAIRHPYDLAHFIQSIVINEGAYDEATIRDYPAFITQCGVTARDLIEDLRKRPVPAVVETLASALLAMFKTHLVYWGGHADES